MRVSRGFTIIEIVIVIVIMAILLVLGVAGFRQTQASARDATLKAEAEAIARGLENYYKTGYTYPAQTVQPGKYPSAEEVLYEAGWTEPTLGKSPNGNILTSWLPGVSAEALNRFGVLTTGAITTPTLANTPIGTIKYQPYVYRPADGWGGDRLDACLGVNDQCSSFDIYYYSEVDGNFKTVSSEHQ